MWFFLISYTDSTSVLTPTQGSWDSLSLSLTNDTARPSPPEVHGLVPPPIHQTVQPLATRTCNGAYPLAYLQCWCCETLWTSAGVCTWMWRTYFHVKHFRQEHSKFWWLTFDNEFIRTIGTTFNVGFYFLFLNIQCTPKLILDLKDDGILRDHKCWGAGVKLSTY